MKSVDRRYTFSSFPPCWTRNGLLLAVLATSPFRESARLCCCVRERQACWGERGEKGVKKWELNLFIYLLFLPFFFFTFLSDALENWILVFLYFLVLADANFPTASMCRDGAKQIRADGHSIPALLEAILTLMPLDTYCWSPVKISTLIIKIIFFFWIQCWFLIGQRDGCDG